MDKRKFVMICSLTAKSSYPSLLVQKNIKISKQNEIK